MPLLLHIENLSIHRKTPNESFTIIDRLSLKMGQAENLGIVGESGSGKSMLALAIMGLLSPKMLMRADYFSLDGEDLMKMSAEERTAYVCSKAAIIFSTTAVEFEPLL